MFDQVFKHRRVLITGHTGFKGSWLAIWLDLLGARVSGFSLDPPTTPSNYALSNVGPHLVHDLRGDIRDAEAVSAAVRLVQPELVFHMAAQPLVRLSYRQPAYTFDVNVMGTIQVLEAVRLLGEACIVVAVTSDKCYQNNEQVWGFRECDPMGGGDPYSASKGAAELAVACWRQSFFQSAKHAPRVRLASVRAGNVMGGGDWAEDRIVPDCIRALSAGEPVLVRSPDAVRPWQHVLDPLSGYLELAAQMLSAPHERQESGWNFGPLPHSAVSVRRVVSLILSAWGEGTWVHESPSDGSSAATSGQVREAHALRLSIDKAMTELNWRPRWDIEQTVRRTVEWYRRSRVPGTAMRSRCLEDIQEYVHSARQLTRD